MSIATMTEEERSAHAKRALIEFQRLISIVYGPLLRAITGKPKLKVEPAAKISATDGKTVWLMVPWVLGETREHDRSLCGRRDPESFEMLCPACDQRDAIDSTVFHESAHITFGSFEEVDPNKYRELVKLHAPWVTDPDALDLPWHYKGRRVFVQVLAGIVEPVFLPTIQNVVEDIYVNRRLFSKREGVEPSMQAHMVKVFSRGFHQADGTHCSWGDQSLDMQAVMGVYNLGGRLPYLNRFLDPRVDEEITKDDVLGDLMESIPFKGDAYIRGEIGLKVLTRLRELGFCIPPSQQEPEPEPQGEEGDEEQEGEESPEPQKGSGGGGSTKGVESSQDDEDAEAEAQDGEPSDDEESDEGEPSGTSSEGSEEAEESADEEDGAGGGQGDESEDDSYEEGEGKAEEPTPEELDKQAAEEIAKMAKQMFGHEDQEQEAGDYTEPEDAMKPQGESQEGSVEKEIDKAIKWQKFDAPPEGINDYQEIEAEVDPSLNYYGGTSWEPIKFDPGLISGETARLRTVFAANRKRRLSGSLTSGPKLDVPHLHRIGQEDFRIFGKNDRPDRRDWFVLVGLDDSGSTLTNGAAKVIREMGLGLGEMLTGVGVKFAMYAHSGRFQSGSGIAVTHKVIKAPDEPWTLDVKERLQSVGREDTGNLDGHTLEQYRKVILRRRETDKMILYVTDGAMPMSNYNEELEVLQRELMILRSQRVNLFGVGYKTDSPKQHGMDTVVIQGGQDLPGLITGLRERLAV